MADTNFNDVVKAIKEQNSSQLDTTNSINALNDTMREQFKLQARGKKDEEEDRKESKKAGRQSKSGSSSGVLGSFKDGAGFGAGFGIAGMLGKMAGAAGRLIKPIVMAGRLLLGPVGLTLMAAYVLFKNIAENENFKATLAVLSETWTKLKTAFTDLISVFSAASENEGLNTLIENVKNFIPSFIKNVQDIVLDIAATLAESISGVIDTIRALIEGDFKGAFDSIWNVIKGIGDFITRTVDNIIQMFLPTTEDGFISKKFFEVFDMVANIFDNVKAKLIEGVTLVGDNILLAWEAVTNFFSDESIRGAFAYVKDGIWNKITSFTTMLVDGFKNAFSLLTFENLVAGVLGAGKGLSDILWFPINTVIDWISKKFGWSDEDAPKFNLADKIGEWVTAFGKWFGSFLPDIGQIARDLTAKLLGFLPDWVVKGMIKMNGGDPDLFTVKDGAISKKIVDEQRVNPYAELMGDPRFKGIGTSNYVVDTSTNSGDNISITNVAPQMIPSMSAVDQKILNQQNIRAFGFY